jgi:hypothetical protein
MRIFIMIMAGLIYTTIFGQMNVVNSPFPGKWSKTSSSAPQYLNGTLVNFANFGYTRGQYDFKDDSTYSFHGESKQNTNAFILTHEEGKYIADRDSLIIMPERCIVKMLDAYGSLKETKIIASEKRVYSWQMVYFEGIDETQFVLSATQENFIDGVFSSNASYPNSFLYGNKMEPAWKFSIE